MPAIDYLSPLPRYYQLKEILKKQILSGKFKVGKKISSIRQLMKEYHLSLLTVRQALKELASEGLLYFEQGRGSFITKPGIATQMISKFRSRTLGVLIPDVTYFFPPIIRVIEDTATKRGYHIILCNTDHSISKEKTYLRKLKGRVEGFIISPVRTGNNLQNYLNLKNGGIPFVLIGEPPGDIRVDSVFTDDISGAYLAVNHLLDLSHRRIGYIGVKGVDSIAEYERLTGYKKALFSHGIRFNNSLVRIFDFRKKNEQLVRKFFIEKRFTAIFTFNDLVATKVLEITRTLGLKVPDDFALVGYDNSELLTFLDIPLTSVEQPKCELGKRATEILINKIEGKTKKLQKVALKPKLIIRKSSGGKINGNI